MAGSVSGHGEDGRDRTHQGAGLGGDLDGEDVIGATSARLLSACPDRADRLAALSLLGLLLDHADPTGRVRLPLAALAQELEVEPERAVRLLQRLLAVGAVRAEDDAVVVPGAHPPPPRPLRPSRFLANLTAVLEREPSVSAPSRVPPPRAARTAGGAAVRSLSGSRRRALVALGAGLAAMVLATAPSGDPGTSLRTIAPAAPSGRAPWATDRDAPGTGQDVAELGGARSGGSEPARLPGATAAAPPGGQAGSGVQALPDRAPDEDGPNDLGPPEQAGDDGRGQGRALEDGEPAPPSPPSGGPARRRSAPTSVPDGPDRPPAAPEPEPSCPMVVTEVVVSGSQPLGRGPGGLLDGAGGSVLLVTGTVANVSEESLIVESLEVSAGAGRDRVVQSVVPEPSTIAPGEVAGWEARLFTDLGLRLPLLLDAAVTEWSWSEPELAAACPS